MPGVNIKNSKKRAAPSQSASKNKKAHLAKNESANDKGKKRSKPVTAPAQGDSDVTSDEGEIEYDEGLIEEGGGDGELEDESMDVDSQPKVPKDPNGMYHSLSCESLVPIMFRSFSCERITQGSTCSLERKTGCKTPFCPPF